MYQQQELLQFRTKVSLDKIADQNTSNNFKPSWTYGDNMKTYI